ncbi:anti-sigma regulatory factor (Ser/Thr protein kinase) [Nocardiopsis mwathae]|uniref:Anti-sigma regulatory factor (Ser/Thr protein kinase) n=1 Tax=Nocardiopsis mwathae TaxID=1472723 RepID=A0A7W9YE63_9ACTN|nr:anti-sigma regulatory factor (Ser/Thr protein kinase) [Nocardiopsis mwathae]
MSEFKEFPGEPGYCPDARRFVRTVLVDHPRVADDAELVVSELFGNGCRHTRSGQGGTLGVGVSALVTDLTVVSVVDQGPTAADLAARRRPVPVRRPADPNTLGWRGMHLVSELTDDWGYTPNDDGGLTVWAVFESPHPSMARLTG